MVRALMGRGREQEEDQDVAGVWEGWAETDLGQAPVEAVFARVVVQVSLTT